MKEWFTCPICGQKIAKIDKNKSIEGVFLQCKKCKNEVEITNKIRNESEPEPTVKKAV
jgi:transcription elongation factor Elf1